MESINIDLKELDKEVKSALKEIELQIHKFYEVLNNGKSNKNIVNDFQKALDDLCTAYSMLGWHKGYIEGIKEYHKAFNMITNDITDKKKFVSKFFDKN